MTWQPEKRPDYIQESWVKKQIKAMLTDLGIWYFMPFMGGYGVTGIPDFVCCQDGYFVAIEAKRKEGQWKQDQQDRGAEIEVANGVYFVVDEDGLQMLYMELTNMYDVTVREDGVSCYAREVGKIYDLRGADNATVVS